MDASIGKALREARLQKNLTIEDAARATKIRADRLNELERDEYARFPSLAYARNFLILYAKYLGVDVSKYAVLDVGRPVFTADYQYMQGESLGAIRSTGPRKKPIRRSRWLLAFGIFAVAITIGAITALFILSIQRLPSLDQLLNRRDTEESDVVAPAASPTPAPAEPAEEPKAAPSPEPEEGAAPPQAGVDANDEALLALGLEGERPPETPPSEEGPMPVTPETATPEEPAAATDATPAPSPSPTPAEPSEREIKVSATKRVRVKIIRDEAGSQAVYDNWLEPGMPPLTLRGKRFWIESKNPGALKVTSDGTPVEAPARSGATKRGIEIQ